MSYKADDYSDQMDDINDGEKLPITSAKGEVRFSIFEFTVPSGGTAGTSVVALCEIPEGARVIGGAIDQDALGNTLDLGLVGKDGNGYIDKDKSVADDTDLFLDGIDTSIASQDTFAELSAGDANALYTVDKQCLLVAVAAGAWTAGKILKGYVKYVGV